MLLPADPRASYFAQKGEIDRCVLETLESGWYILGSRVKAFEDAFAAYHGVGSCVGMANGTDAVLMALHACGVRADDAVVTVSHTAIATVSAIDWLGARPILVDIDPVTYTIDPTKLDATLRENRGHRIKAVVVVHLYGHSADMDTLLEIAGRHDVALIEDCAQAHGATYRGRKVGTMGLCGTFSFYPTKNLGAFGDGGAVIASDPALVDKLRLLHQYGWRERYISETTGYNSRLDELQAAILSVKLPGLDAGNDRRRTVAMHYNRAFADLPVICPTEVEGCRHVYHQYVLRSNQRDTLRRHLTDAGIGTAILYPQPIHMQAGYRDRIATGAGGLATTERAAKEVLCLPIYPELTDAQEEQIEIGVRSFFDEGH